MADDKPKPITAAVAKAYAEQCRALAKVAHDETSRGVLIQIAGMWEKIAAIAKPEQ